MSEPLQAVTGIVYGALLCDFVLWQWPRLLRELPSRSANFPLVLPARIERAVSGPEPDVLPLHHGRIWHSGQDSNLQPTP